MPEFYVAPRSERERSIGPTVWGIMVYPGADSESIRRRHSFTSLLYLAQCRTDLLKADPASRRAEALRDHERTLAGRFVNEQPAQVLLERAEKHSRGGYVAGRILELRLSPALHDDGRKVSMGAIRHCLMEVYNSETSKIPEGGIRQESTIKKCWGRFKSVSHFYLVCNRLVRLGREPVDFIDNETDAFLSMAEMARRVADQHRLVSKPEWWRPQADFEPIDLGPSVTNTSLVRKASEGILGHLYSDAPPFGRA